MQHIGTRIEEPAAIGAANVSRHFYVDVQNPEESNYDRAEQHIAIDPGFLAEVQTSNDNNILQFLSLPELIPAKKRKRQQPLLDFTQSIILTSKDYSKGLEEILAKKEATAAAALKRKEEKEATKEQRKAQKEQQQKEKEDRAKARAEKQKKKTRSSSQKGRTCSARPKGSRKLG